MKKGACDNKLVMQLIRILTAEQIKSNFSIRLEHIRSELNTVADSLSRGSISVVRRINPELIRLDPVFPQGFHPLANAR